MERASPSSACPRWPSTQVELLCSARTTLSSECFKSSLSNRAPLPLGVTASSWINSMPLYLSACRL
eukprot:scaffold10708_cov17-Tisochrysis_lutea.AAC.1